jgi:hypothetical protein
VCRRPFINGGFAWPRPHLGCPWRRDLESTLPLFLVAIIAQALAAALSDSHDRPKKQPQAVLGDLVTLTTLQIRLNGLGSSRCQNGR